MFIHEAINARTPDKPYITRRSWGYLTDVPVVAPIRIQPTDTPDCCIVEGTARRKPCRGWEPTAGDLTADDWDVVGL